MKVKVKISVLWEEKDIVAGIKLSSNPPTGENVMIGYDPMVEGENRYMLISLSDGMIIMRGYPKAELASALDQSGYIPLEMATRMSVIGD